MIPAPFANMGIALAAPPSAAVVGAGPAGLMAAEVLALGGVRVDVYDAMPSAGRKFLLAGKGGLNLTHAEPLDAFLSRFGPRRAALEPMLAAFGPDAIRAWARDLGIETFVGTSGRVFPIDQKAAPLLRAWLRRLREKGVLFHSRHRWQGFDENGALRFATLQGTVSVQADAVVLALGGGSWPKLGSDGAWVSLLAAKGVPIAPLKPSNCGFDVDAWSEHFRTRFAGQPVKPVRADFTDAQGQDHSLLGEFIITDTGAEGGLVYTLSPALRDTLETLGVATLRLDLAPGRDLKPLTQSLAKPRGGATLAKHLQKRAGIEGVKAGLLRELADPEDFADPAYLAAAIKSLCLRLKSPRPLDEAISTAGGVAFEGLDEYMMIQALPGVFCAGEMLDWEAPTGGYLLTACLATGRRAGEGVLAWLGRISRFVANGIHP